MKRDRKNERAKRRTKRLAPLEHQTYASGEESGRDERNGVLRVTTGSLRVPAGITTEGKGASLPGEWIAVLVIVTAACTFIAFITYLIATGSGK